MDDRNLINDIDITGYEALNGSAKADFIAAKENKSEKQLKREHFLSERYKKKAAALREKNRKKAEIREQREYMRKEQKRLKDERNKKYSDKKSNGGWLAAVISLSLATLILASALTFTALTPTESDNRLESGYRKSFYDTMVQVDNMDLNLSKTLATKDRGATQLYLTDLAVNSELAENDLQRLPLNDENKFYTTKIVNQVGDFAKYLNKKIIKGETLSKTDYENLRNLYKANAALKNALQTAVKDMDNDFNFSEMGEKFEGNAILKNFDELQELSVEYPELIYDGPFSDGRDGAEIKGLSGREITEAEAEDIFRELFSDYSPENVRCSGKSTGMIASYGIEADIKGELGYAQISVVGGKPLMFAYAGSCKEINYDDGYATEKALEFLKKAEFEDMKAVWINLANNVYTINFAPEKSGVIIYPDLVKVRVCAETGMVIGMEATGYFKNHTERTVPSATLTKAQAKKYVADEISVETARLAIVPTGETSERLCYEFSGTYEGETYYVYIDAENGRQVEMFKVINSEDGALLM